MSYDLSLWDPGKHPPAPTSFEEAAEMFLSLDDVNDGVNPNFIEFAKRLWANHPDESTWLGNPVEQASRFQAAKFSLSLPMDKRVELTRMVVDAGIACGLVVFDDQLGVAFHPEGLIFPDEWQERWAQLKDELDTTLGDANPAQVCEQLGRVIFRRFVCTPGAATATTRRYFREEEAYRQNLVFSVERESNALRGSIHVEGRDHWIETILERALGRAVPGATYRFSFQDLPLTSDEELRRFVALLDRKIRPAVLKVQEARGLHEVLNAADCPAGLRVQADARLALVAMVAARLAGSAAFAEAAQQAHPDGQRLADFLRTHVTPTRWPAQDPRVDAAADRILSAFDRQGRLAEGEADPLLRTAMQKWLGPRGFVADEAGFSRPFAGGVQRIRLQHVRPPAPEEMLIWFETWHDVVSRTSPTHRFSLRRAKIQPTEFWFPPVERGYLQEGLAKMGEHIQTQALPILDRARDLRQVHEMMSGAPEQRFESFGQVDGVMPQLVARIVGSRAYQELAPPPSAIPPEPIGRMRENAVRKLRRELDRDRGKLAFMGDTVGALERCVTRIAESHGFVPRGYRFVREFEGGFLSITQVVDANRFGRECYGIGTTFSISLEEVNLRYRLASGLHTDVLSFPHATYVMHFPAKDYTKVCSFAELDATIQPLDEFAASALPVLEQCRDIRFLDRQMSPEGKVLDEWPSFLSLVVARMAGNPGFEERVTLYERHPALNQAYRLELLRTIADRLRDRPL